MKVTHLLKRLQKFEFIKKTMRIIPQSHFFDLNCKQMKFFLIKYTICSQMSIFWTKRSGIIKFLTLQELKSELMTLFYTLSLMCQFLPTESLSISDLSTLIKTPTFSLLRILVRMRGFRIWSQLLQNLLGGRTTWQATYFILGLKMTR